MVSVSKVGALEKAQHVLRALDELEKALEQFRGAYTAWLEGTADAATLSRALAEAERRLDAARAALAAADDH